MTTQYTYTSEAEANAARQRFIRRGYTVFLPYYEPLNRWSGSGQTWNIIIR